MGELMLFLGLGLLKKHSVAWLSMGRHRWCQ